MQAMILAAGRGERMRPLTDHQPKPLLKAGGRPLIEWLIDALSDAQIHSLVINHAWLGEQLQNDLGDGSRLGATIRWSGETAALETAGGIANALPLLSDAPFAVINGDLFTDFDFNQLRLMRDRLENDGLQANCVMVANPEHNLSGDFTVDSQAKLRNHGKNRLTYAGIGIYRPCFFEPIKAGQRAALGPMLREAADRGLIGGYHHHGQWSDIGSPKRLAELNARLNHS